MIKSFSDVVLGVAVVGAVVGGLSALHERHVALVDRQAQAEPAILQACTEIAAYARGPFVQADGAVKEQCLLRFDQRYAQKSARAEHGDI